MSVDRGATMKAALLKKTQQSYEKREDSGQFGTIWADNPAVKIWKCGAAEHIIDILPYVTGDHDPDTKAGEWTYVLVIWVHYGVGVNQDAYVCPARNYNLPCPICEYREQLRSQPDYDEDLVKSLTPKRRSLYWVIVYDNPKEEEKGPQIFDVAHWFMERHLSVMAKIPERVGQKSLIPYIPFSDLTEGKSVAFERKGMKQNSDFVGHRFVDRSYALSQELADSLVALDSLIVIHTYEEIKVAFEGTGATEAVPTEVPPPTPPVVAPTPSTTPLRKIPITPTVTPVTTPPVATKPPPVTAVGSNVCPVGGVFGQDCEQLEACSGCPNWNSCSEAADKIAADASTAGGVATPPPTPVPTPRPIPAVRTPLVRPAPVVATTPGVTPTGPRRIMPIPRKQ